MNMIAIQMCHGCKKLFTFNPDRVPVVQFIDGETGPICKDCLELSNVELKKQGLPLLYALPDAYDPLEG